MVKRIIKEDLEAFKIDKTEWEETIQVNKKTMLKVFLAGASVATLIWVLVFYIYINTGFRTII